MRVALATTVLLLGVSVAPPMAVAQLGARSVAPAAAVARASTRNPTPRQIETAVRNAEHSKSLWATVNICNTAKYRNTLGVRGQMPALGFASWLTMFIRVNYYSKTEKRFLPAGAATRVRLGRLSSGLQQDGATFGPYEPHAGLLNATIQFVWRRSGKLLGETTRGTTSGHPDADFSSPRHYSASQCLIK